MARAKKIKITINVDAHSLEKLRTLAAETGTPYQRILNQVLKSGLEQRSTLESRVCKLEQEIKKLKRDRAA